MSLYAETGCERCSFDRKLYFINSYYGMPSIMVMSTSSGQTQQPQLLIGRELQSPSALTIDYNMGGRLFWVDKHRNVIESCTPDGRDRTVMFTQQPSIHTVSHKNVHLLCF